MRRWIALTLSLVMVLSGLTGCAAPASGSDSRSNVSEPNGTVSGNSAPPVQLPPEIIPEPEPEPEPEPQPVLTQEDVDQAIQAAAEHYTAASISVAAIEYGQVTQSGAWGWAVRGTREMTADTKVRVASLTKVAVGLCAMAMAEEGLLDLDAPLSDYWGASVVNPYSQTQPSARTLMSHTSSLRSLEITNGLSNLRGLLQSRSSWRNMTPGEGRYWEYNNFGFCVLGTTLELAADRVLDGYFQEKFLQPMGVRASLHAGFLEAEELASLYYPGGEQARSAAAQASMRVPSEIGRGASYYPGGLSISAIDLARLVAILAGRGSYNGVEYLTPESVQTMEEPQFTVEQEGIPPFQQCLVLRRQEDVMGQSVLYYHLGNAYGVHSMLSYNPETGCGVVVVTVGTNRHVNEQGLYSICAQISEELYLKMEDAL